MRSFFKFFPSRQLTIYMMRLYFTRSAALLALLVLVLLALALLTESGNILAAPGNGQAEIWKYAYLRTPDLISRFLPFAVLLGVLACFISLNHNSEVISMKATGMSAHQILAPMIAASLLVAGLHFLFNETFATTFKGRLDAWKDLEYGALPENDDFTTNAWVMDGDRLIRAALVTGQGDNMKLRDVDVFNRSGGALTSVVKAEGGRRVNGEWELTGKMSKIDIATASDTKLAEYRFGRDVEPIQFTLSNVNPETQNLVRLSKSIQQMKDAGRRTNKLEAHWWHKFSGPLSTMLMPLLAAVAAFGLARSGQLLMRASLGMALGFAYFVADNFALAMGGLGAYAPIIAGWGPFVLFLMIGEAILIRTEE